MDIIDSSILLKKFEIFFKYKRLTNTLKLNKNIQKLNEYSNNILNMLNIY